MKKRVSIPKRSLNVYSKILYDTYIDYDNNNDVQLIVALGKFISYDGESPLFLLQRKPYSNKIHSILLGHINRDNIKNYLDNGTWVEYDAVRDYQHPALNPVVPEGIQIIYNYLVNFNGYTYRNKILYDRITGQLLIYQSRRHGQRIVGQNCILLSRGREGVLFKNVIVDIFNTMGSKLGFRPLRRIEREVEGERLERVEREARQQQERMLRHYGLVRENVRGE